MKNWSFKKQDGGITVKIKLAMLDGDSSYLSRLTEALALKYGDSLQICGFTNPSAAMDALAKENIHVFLADENFQIDVDRLPKNCGFAYLVSGNSIDALKGQRAVCKFQRTDMFYRAIVNIFSECAGDISVRGGSGTQCRLIAFSSPCGGVGTTAMAAGCAVHFSEAGKRVFYLNIEQFSSSGAFFSGEGKFCMDDVIYAIKSKKTNLELKMESCAKQDASGVFFFDPPKLALELAELSGDELIEMINALRGSGRYDAVILDMDFSLDHKALSIFRQSDVLVWVGDGSESSNQKIAQAHRAMQVLDQQSSDYLTDKLMILYNKFSNKTGHILTDPEIKNPGGVPRLEHATPLQVRAHLSKQQFFDNILG